MNRRDEILQCATELIQTHGFNGFSYKDISEQVGISKASIHHHFASKEELGIAYCDAKYTELQAFKDKVVNLPTAIRQLKAYLDKPKKRLETKKMCGINAMQSDSSGMSEILRKAVQRITLLDISIVKGILKQGVESGEFTLVTRPEDMAEVMVSALKGALQKSLLNQDNSYDKIAKSLYQLVVQQ